jgi:hypothetical protein
MSSRRRSSSGVAGLDEFRHCRLTVPLGQLALEPDMLLDDLQAEARAGRITNSLAIGWRSSGFAIARAPSPYRSTYLLKHVFSPRTCTPHK